MPASIQIGDIRVTSVRAGTYWWDGGSFFGVVPKTLWSKTHPADERNLIEAGFNCYIVETAEHRVLIDTGGGVRHDQRARERMKTPSPPDIRDVVAAHGFNPASIDTVINTHLHWDHAGGNTVDSPGGVLPSFPNANYYAQRAELEHGREQHPRDAISYRAANYEPLLESGHLHLLDGDSEIVPGINGRVSVGHNRTMMVVRVHSKGQTWCQFSDLVQFTINVTPTWVSGFDLYPLEAIDTKTALLSQAAEEGWWCSFGHDPVAAFAKVDNAGGRWRTTNVVI